MSVSSRRAITGSVAASIAFVLELTLVPLLLPSIQRQFDLSIGELAWVFNSYGAAVALGVLLGGWLGDVFKISKAFGLGVLFFATGSMLVAYSTSFEGVIFGRVIQGFGGGIFSPLVPLLLTQAVPKRPGKILIVWGSVVGYIAASAPLFYSSILEGFGWNLAFVLLAVVSVTAIAIILSSSTGYETKSYSTSRANYAKLFGARDLWLMIIYVFFTYGSITYFLFRLPLWLSENRFHELSIGFALTVLWLSFSLVSTLLRNKVDEPHIRSILLAAPVFIALGFPIAFFFSSITCLVLSSALVGIGLACSNAPSTQLILKFAPKGTSAVSASLDITFARLGGVTTVTVFAQSTFTSSIMAETLMCVIALICALIATKTV